jgi:hypothetical protein
LLEAGETDVPINDLRMDSPPNASLQLPLLLLFLVVHFVIDKN